MSTAVSTQNPLKRLRALRLDPARRKALLIQAGVQVFARRGIGASRPTDVAKEAGVAEATVYTYFASREALVAEVLDEVARYYEELIRSALGVANGSVAERLTELIERRSEEHTSELQSRRKLACRLLLEKKKTSKPPLTLCF